MDPHLKFVIATLFIVTMSIFLYKKLEKFSNRTEVIFFYTDWCKYSQQMVPIWNDVTRALSNTNVLFSKIDCDKSNLCKENKINYLPTIILKKNKKEYKYTDDIDFGQLSNFIMKHIDL